MNEEKLNFKNDEEMEEYALKKGIDTSIPDFLNGESLRENTDIDIRFKDLYDKENSKKHHEDLKKQGFFKLNSSK